MFLPYSTDAPIYHWPVATVALIAANTLAFVGMIFAQDETILGLCLTYGELHPTQWVTANFLHADVLHLLGNLFGLWTFGLIVEGKIGWWRFLAVYFGLGVLVLMITQFLSLGMDSGFGLGASGIIYGLLGMAVIWAPENEVQCVTFLGFRVFFFELTLWAVAVLWIGFQIVILLFSGISLSSEVVHLLGAVVGIVVAVVLLRKEWVECENWDVFSVWAGRHTMSRDQVELARAKEREERSPEEMAAQRAAALAQIQAVLAEGKIELALAAHLKMARQFEDWALPEPDLCKLIVGCSRKGRHADVVRLSREYLQRYTERAAAVRLKLAETLVRHDDRPAQAKRVLARLSDASLGPQEQAYRRQLEREAAAKIESGMIEPATEDW